MGPGTTPPSSHRPGAPSSRRPIPQVTETYQEVDVDEADASSEVDPAGASPAKPGPALAAPSPELVDSDDFARYVTEYRKANPGSRAKIDTLHKRFQAQVAEPSVKAQPPSLAADVQQPAHTNRATV